MTQVIGIKYEETGQVAYLLAKEDLLVDELVVVKEGKGSYLARVVTPAKKVDTTLDLKGAVQFVRLATPKDKERYAKNKAFAKASMPVVSSLVAKNGLEMKVLRIVFPLERSHVLITFTAEGRVDFRALLRDLAGHFRMRIELRQLNHREEYKVYGGLGPCGRALCCSSFLGEFPPVSIKMVKNQGLSLNSGKSNGLCGRLMCCLSYEDTFYQEAKEAFPDVGSYINTEDGLCEVISIDVFTKTIKARLDGHISPVTYALEEVVENG